MTWHWSIFSCQREASKSLQIIDRVGKGSWGVGGGWREVYKVRRDCRDYHCMIKIMAGLHVIKEMHSRLDKKKEKENGKPVTALFTHRNFMQTCCCFLLLLLFFWGWFCCNLFIRQKYTPLILHGPKSSCGFSGTNLSLQEPIYWLQNHLWCPDPRG